MAAGNASPATVAAYIRALSGQNRQADAAGALKPRAAATISRYLVHIGWAYRMAGQVDPTAAPLVRLEHKAARKAIGTRQRQARAIRFKGDVVDLDGPASGICLSTLLKACRRDMLGDRDRALLLVAYDSGCRRSELVAITVTDVDGPGSDGAGTLFVGSIKTDREREGVPADESQVIVRARPCAGAVFGASNQRNITAKFASGRGFILTDFDAGNHENFGLQSSFWAILSGITDVIQICRNYQIWRFFWRVGRKARHIRKSAPVSVA